mmetsp:Transcript_27895/g.64834  ORF Transcript_27895/g.64834 Transcript_27895/m.64834 type:complete len:214 (-) Transcript_27895:1656-2297(-)
MEGLEAGLATPISPCHLMKLPRMQRHQALGASQQPNSAKQRPCNFCGTFDSSSCARACSETSCSLFISAGCQAYAASGATRDWAAGSGSSTKASKDSSGNRRRCECVSASQLGKTKSLRTSGVFSMWLNKPCFTSSLSTTTAAGPSFKRSSSSSPRQVRTGAPSSLAICSSFGSLATARGETRTKHLARTFAAKQALAFSKVPSAGGVLALTA